MVITTDTTFVPGTYMLPNGVHIGASGVTLDLNGATLLGTAFTNAGVTCLGHDDVVIRNGAAAMYYYGVRIESGSNITVESCVLSGNYVDPASKGPTPPFLNINVGPVIPNFTNLGGGLYARAVDGALIRDNVLRDQENGIDGYTVTNSTICGNDASDNTGWGIHLNGSTNNLIDDNIADRCTRIGLGDSAGLLLVMGSHDNTITGNSFRHSGDGFFIGNENGCPSNDNLVAGNDGSNAGANAFEATFSSGNRFLGNTANASNYGFWLGYSHSGTEVSGNEIRANNTSGIEIEHGQDNVIIGNTIIGNGGSAIVLRTDNVVHFPAGRFPCLALPNQAASSGYEVRDNIIKSNFGRGFDFTNTTASAITNNLVAANAGGSASSNGAGNTWSVAPTPGVNIVGGPTLGGNYWSEYAGVDRDADGLGDTLVPFTNGGQIAAPGDPHPLIGDPEIDPFDNPMSLCSLAWVDYGRNRRTNGAPFDTANGTHFATDGVDLLLLEGTNDSRLSRFNPATLRYDALANAPEAVWDGGDLQWAGLRYFATVGIAFDV
ncbi:MAG: right-handed parallel beta-helix repeat-containing protein, partial [Phycisphaerales bacterium]|nr:right-handed parallel beta-helix repeat-containing protein [Phycisphaerales bacterium]